MPPTLANRKDRERLIKRVQRLQPDTLPYWGSMNVREMLAHCADALRNATGELPIAVRNLPLARTGLVKWLMIDVIPFPKGAPTARELREREPGDIDAERAALIALFERFAPEQVTTTFAPHPLFGELTPKQWGKLAYKHVNHHLRQFGV